MRDARHPSSASPTTGSLTWIHGAVSPNYQMDPPMSEWFQSILQSLDSVAYATKVHDRFPSPPGMILRPWGPICVVSAGYDGVTGPIPQIEVPTITPICGAA